MGLADAEQGRRVRPRLLPARQIFEVNVFRPPLALPASHGDVLAPPACSAPVPWSAVWKRLHDIELDRSHRVLAWRILHGSVRCGAFRLHLGMTDEQGAACPHAQCAASVQTLSHMFLACPIAAAVWHWVCLVWAAASGLPPPPVFASVMLADDARSWFPPPAMRPLWTRLRLATLHALWCASGQARSEHVHVDARRVAASVMVSCKRFIFGDLAWLIQRVS